MNWPIGCGKEFQGVYDRRRAAHRLLFRRVRQAAAPTVEEVLLDDPRVGELIGADRWQQLRDDVELLGAGREFDMDEVRRGQLSPVFFGSALTNFGVEPFLEDFLQMTPPPLPAHGRLRRDRRLQPGLLRLRLQNSGKYEQGPPRPPRLHAHLLRQVRAGGRGVTMCRAAKRCACRQPQQLMAAGARDHRRGLRRGYHRRVRPRHLLHRRHHHHAGQKVPLCAASRPSRRSISPASARRTP